MKTKLFFALVVLISFNQLLAEVRVAKIFNDNMVIQRNKDIPIWGWASKGEKVTIEFNGQKLLTKADENGKWLLNFKPMKEGGPFEMTIKGKNSIGFKNIYIGEVWLCSGQSNMSFPVSQLKNVNEEIANANFPMIRVFTVPSKFKAKPLDDLESGEWKLCNPTTVSKFSAVAYLFARNLYLDLNVPIGIIHSSWGGTNAETWMSSEAIQEDNDFKNKIIGLASKDVEQEVADLENKKKEWILGLETNDNGRKDKWQLPETDLSKWKDMKLPTFWEDAGLKNLDGVVWFRKDIELTQAEAESGLTLNFGPIDDGDETYLNGNLIGQTNYLAANSGITPRIYKVDMKFLKPGKNSIVVRVIDKGGVGGIGGKPEQLFYEIGGIQKPLAGNWLYIIGFGAVVPPTPGPNIYPTLLYNGMINALIPFAIRGVVWYQGENNTSRAYQYRSLFPRLIKDWRKHWNENDFPFLFVQLANFKPATAQPGESNWAELREAQTMALSNKNTGMAVAVDLGDADNIHPKNKQDVGYRLALVARKLVYNENIISSGPMYESMKIENDKIIITFKNIGSGLITKDKYNYVKGFVIAGDDKKFYWAKASIDGNKVTVYSDQVKRPIAVRYGWADNPDDANLYNKENLPTAPFRTDSWDGLTKDKK